MKTFLDSIPCAVIRQPSSSRCGARSMISRSLNDPGSDSSAFTTRYVGRPVPLARKLAFLPIGKPAPPRPRRFEAISSSTICCGSSPRAFASVSYPPPARYSESCFRSRSSAPARTICLTGTAQLLDDSGDVVRSHGLAVAVVDDDHRRPAAAPRALDRPQRDLAALGRLPRRDVELALERLEHLLGPDERAGDVRADLDEVPADRLQMEHVVEGRDRLAVRGREPERVSDLDEGLGRQPAAVPLLREPQGGQRRRPRVRVARCHLLDLVVQRPRGHYRSVSPITASREPTI